MKYIKIIIVYKILLIVLAGCNSINDFNDEPFVIEEILIEDIEQYLEEDKILVALQDINFLERNNKFNFNGTLEQYKQTGLEMLLEKFNKSLGEEDFENAFRYFISIQT